MFARLLLSSALGLIAMTSTAAAKDERVYELRTYTVAEGKLDAFTARMKQTIPLLTKSGITLHGAFVPLSNPKGEFITLVSHANAEAQKSNWAAFQADADWKKLLADTETDGKLARKIETVSLVTTDFSPKLDLAQASGSPRVFELRTYIATKGKLDRLNARFRDHTVKLFERYGMTNVVYWNAAPSEKQADVLLVYMLAHPTDEARKSAFDKFRDDPDWKAARAASEKGAGGSLTEAQGGVVSVSLKALDFSPLK